MSGYLPLFQPGAAVTFTALAGVVGGRLVQVSGDRQVSPAAADSASVIGVASRDALAGENVTVYLLRHAVHRVPSGVAVVAGGKVYAGASGVVVATGTNPIGTALTGGGTGVLIEFA